MTLQIGLVVITCLLVTHNVSAESNTGYIAPAEVKSELIIIDPAVQDPYMLYQAMSAKFNQNSVQNHHTEIVFLKPEQEPLLQIRNLLKDKSNLSQLSIVSHASNGALFLSGKWIDQAYINQQTQLLSEIGSSLNSGADLKLYGCNLAAGLSGESFINRMAELTKLDVAASIDTTGGHEQGYNWDLEYQVGNVDSKSDFFAALPISYSSTLNHFRYGTMAVEPIAGESGKVRLKAQIGYTLNHSIMSKLVNSAVGTVNCEKNYFAGFTWGDGQGESQICVQLLSKDSATNDALVEIVSQGANGYEPGIVHQYQADGDYTLSWNSYARSPAMSQDNSYWRGELTTSVVNGEVTNASPVTAVSSLVYVQDDHLFTMQISGVDQDGDKIQYRWGERKEFYSGNSNAQVATPAGMQLSSEGLITWDLAADKANGDQVTYTDNANPSTVTSNRWQAAVVLEDLDINGLVKSKAPLDFVFVVSDPDNASPGFNLGPVISGTQYIQLHKTTTFQITATDLDENGDPDVPSLSVLNPPSTDPAVWSTSIISEDPATGTAIIEVTFTPSADMLGKAYAVIFSAKDSNGITSEAPVNLVIVNETPIAIDDTAFTQQAQTVVIDVLANDSDPDGDPLTITQINAPNGTAQLNLDGTIAYTPDANFSGLETLSYTISDGIGSVATANALVTVNGKPIAVDDVFNINEDTSSALDVLANDSDPNSDPLSLNVTNPSHGQLNLVNQILTYTPNAEFYGTDSFSYTISDGNGGSDSANVTVTVLSVNDLPVASNDSAVLDEDQSVSITVLANDSDPENDPLIVTSHQSLHGSTVSNADQSLTYTPSLNYFGTDQLTYTISDGNGGESTAIVDITVRPVNDGPTAFDDSATLDEDSSIRLTPLSNDVDVEGEQLSLVSAVASSGTVSITANNELLYVPAENFEGSTQIDYVIADPSGLQSAATILLSVTEVNDAPIANADSALIDEDSSLNYAVLNNDNDIESQPLTVTLIQANHGQASVETDGSITYIPDADFNGTDTINYTIDDGHGGQDSAQLIITVSGVNDDPVAVNDSVNLDEDSSITIPVLVNDSDIDGDRLTVTAQSTPNGAVSVTAYGLVQYTPNANFNGSDSLSYTISDGNGGSASAIVSIAVVSINDKPNAVDDAVSVDEDGSVTVQVLDNDSDLDNDLLIVTTQPAANGTVVIGLDGSITYVPDSDFNGKDTISYTIDDGNGGQDSALLSITVNPINDSPVAVDDYANVEEDGEVTFSVLNNDSDVDNDDLTLTLMSSSHGSSVNHNDGTITYKPEANYNGSDSIQYSVSDGHGGTAQAVIYLDVTAVNDVPVAENDLISMQEDTSVQFDLLLNDSDVEFALNPASAVLLELPQYMSASLENGVVTLSPNADFNGNDTLTYQVSDAKGAVSNIASVAISVAAVNDAPRTEPDFAIVEEDIILDIAVLANDTDIDDGNGESSLDTNSVLIVQAPLHGQISNHDGLLSYQPDNNYVGSDSFSYTVADLNGAISQTTLVTLTVQGINDAPVAVEDSATLEEDSSVALTVIGNDTDVDSMIDSDSVSIFSQASHGSVSIGTKGEVTYTPNPDYFGDDSFSYTIKDSEGATSLPSSVNITITAINDAPRLQDDIAELVEDGVTDINVLGNDEDIDGELNLESLALSSQPKYGAVSVLPSGLIRYTPIENYYGPDSFSYAIEDNDGVSSEAKVQISINSINDAPLAQSDAAVLEEDGSVTISILDNDSDLDGALDLSSVVITDQPSSGSLQINADGSVVYTPDANFNGNDSFSYQVSDDAGQTSESIVVSLQVSAVNDAPTISGSSPETLIEGDVYQFEPISLDVDNDTLSFSISGLPAWASFEPLTGALSGTPTYNDAGQYGPIVISVSDGILEAHLETFYLEVAVLDSDADGIPDTVELELGLDPFDGSDAKQDTDGDGLSNFDEWLAGSNLYKDDVAPELTIPSDIWIDATGLFTTVSIGQAKAYDYVEGVRSDCCQELTHSLGTAQPMLEPGHHQVMWTAIDAAGNMTEQQQNIYVRPLISLPQDQLVSQGNQVSVSVHLNGVSPEYPLSVAYTVTGSAIEGEHHDLSHGVVVFEVGQVEAEITFNTFDIQQNEVIVIQLDEQMNLGSRKQHYVTITLDNLAPEVQLSSHQNGEKRTLVSQVDGVVEIHANYTDPNNHNTHSLDWSLTDSDLQNAQVSTVQGVIQKVAKQRADATQLETWQFDPSGLADGVYTMRVTVTDDGEPNLSHFSEHRVRVSKSTPVLTADDSDSDGVADNIEGLTDSDNDGIPDYLDNINAANVLPERGVNTQSYLVECDPGVECRLGHYAVAGVYRGAQVADSDIQARLQGIMAGDFIDVGGVFNVEAHALSEHNQTVNIVIPQRNQIPENGSYRQFIPGKGWFVFEADANNKLMSAPGVAGYCPPPGSDEYNDGLNQGDWCVQLVVEDGGSNDGDEMVNGIVNITGCVIKEEIEPVADPDVEVELLTEGGGSSGGSMQLNILYLLVIISFFRSNVLRNLQLKRHANNFVWGALVCSLLLGLTLSPQKAYAKEVNSADSELTGWFVSGFFGGAKSSIKEDDINNSLKNAGLTAEVIDLDSSTTSWKIGLGYGFSDNWFATLEYLDLGEASVRIKGTTNNPQAFYATASQFYPKSAKGVGLNLGYRYQFARDFSMLLYAGGLRWQADYDSYDIDNQWVASSEKDGFSFYGGLGLEYALSKSLRFSVQWNHVELGDTSRELFGAGIQYQF
ncbi:hypothetical protein TUM4445_13510 [Shewanella sp. MBTL60-112-B2]|nr:hypothetical protein TUM4444_07520 [Shewanella sp. MBTL60-112-B1]GIU30304.1 hypothetical protein TUM4445_13510 [Shewanella sp. MBTL60-112-B2]